MQDLTSSVYGFEKLRSGNFLYVDKTEYIWQLMQPVGESYFLSRPRRFGKSLMISTIKAVFEGKKDLFKGLALYDKPYEWKPYPVIHLDLGNCAASDAEELKSYLHESLQEIADAFRVPLRGETLSKNFEFLISELYKTAPVVILIDEYDKPILNNILRPDAPAVLSVLKGFYSSIKTCEWMERFVFITGVSKFCHVSLFSDLNNLTDITMDARYAAMFGYTQEELEANFADRIAAVAGDRDPVEFKRELREWYNGYRFSAKAPTVYNPVSLAKFFQSGGEFRNYWFATGTPTFLMELAKSRDFNFAEALKDAVPEVAFSAFEIENIDPLSLLLQTGYVTIKGTEQRFGQTWYFLDFPNREVEGAFSTYILHSYAGETQTEAVKFTAEMATALLNGDLNRLRKIIEVFFAGIPYTVHKKNEATFQAIFFALFRLLGEFIDAESCTNDGRIDAVVRTEKAVYLFEFKMDRDPMALEQIRKKEYFKPYLMDKRPIRLIGVNFDSEQGNLTEWKTEQIQGRD